MKYATPDEAVADAVLAAVQESGRSELSVSKAAGIPDATWDRIVRKRVGSLRVDQLTRIAETLDMDVRDLMPAPQPVLA